VYEQDVEGTAFDATGRWLIVVAGTTVAVWQPGDWRERRRFEHEGDIEAVRVSPDGRRLATRTRWSAGRDSGVHLARVFDLASGNETGWEYTSGGSYASNEFMQKEAARRQRALAGGDTASVRAAEFSWPALELSEPEELVSADGAWAVRASRSVATLRDVAADREIGKFDPGTLISSVHFVPARAPRWLVSGDHDGTLAVWPIRTEDLADQACERLRATLGAQALKTLMADAHAERGCGTP
jgi:WD40 repeat protein